MLFSWFELMLFFRQIFMKDRYEEDIQTLMKISQSNQNINQATESLGQDSTLNRWIFVSVKYKTALSATGFLLDDLVAFSLKFLYMTIQKMKFRKISRKNINYSGLTTIVILYVTFFQKKISSFNNHSMKISILSFQRIVAEIARKYSIGWWKNITLISRYKIYTRFFNIIHLLIFYGKLHNFNANFDVNNKIWSNKANLIHNIETR